MTKKNIKIKKNKGSNISITIENNLNANNKQINHQPIKRRRRKKKVENTDEINDETLQQSLQKLPPLKDVSYIKGGPVGAFKIWRDTMDSYNTTVPMNQAQQLGLVPPQLPAPPTQQALPAPPTPAPATPAPPASEKPLTLENFKEVMSMIREQQQRPPASWGQELIDDDDEPRMPASPAFSRASKPSDLDYEMNFEDELETSIAEIMQIDTKDPEIKKIGAEVKQILNKARIGTETRQAKRLGTLHANKNWAPRGDYKDTEAYQIAYNTALNKKKKDDDVIPIEGKTRQQTKKLSTAEALSAGREFREPLERANKRIIFDNDDEAKILQDEIDALNLKIPDLSDMENWNEEEELAKAGLKPLKKSVLKEKKSVLKEKK
jgi:hypothetical protein